MKLNKVVKVLIMVGAIILFVFVATTAKLISTEKVNVQTPNHNKFNDGIVSIPKNSDNPSSEISSKEPANKSSPIPITNSESSKIESTLEEETEEVYRPVKEEPKDLRLQDEKTEPQNEEKINNKDKEKDESEKNKEKEENKNNNKDNDNKGKNASNNNPNKKQEIIKQKFITKENAISIGINKVGTGAKIKEVEAELDDNPPKYKLKIESGKFKYVIEIHAITGSVIDFEKE